MESCGLSYSVMRDWRCDVKGSVSAADKERSDPLDLIKAPLRHAQEVAHDIFTQHDQPTLAEVLQITSTWIFGAVLQFDNEFCPNAITVKGRQRWSNSTAAPTPTTTLFQPYALHTSFDTLTLTHDMSHLPIPSRAHLIRRRKG